MLKIILFVALAVLTLSGFVLFFIVLYRKRKYHKKQVERALKMVPYLVTIPRNTGQEKSEGMRDQRDVAREIISNAENMFNTLFAIYKGGIKNIFKNFIYRPRHVAFEIIVSKKEICFYLAVPYILSSMIEKAVTAHYPEAQIQQAEEHNIFSPERKMTGVAGGHFYGYKNHRYPIKTYLSIDNEPMETVTNALSMLEEDEGAAIQILIRPINPKIMLTGKKIVQKIQKGPGQQTSAMDIAGQVINPGSEDKKPKEAYRTTPMEEQVMKEIDRKASKFGYETRIRVVVAARDNNRADLVYNQIKSAFNQYSDLSLNGFKMRRENNLDRLITNYVFSVF